MIRFLLTSVIYLAIASSVLALTPGVKEDLQQLSQKLDDESAKQDDRDEAARRLISRQTPQAQSIILSSLNASNRGSQLAAARALSTDPHPDPALINRLSELIGIDRPLTEAAIEALAAYRDNPAVAQRLENLAAASDEREATRLASIRALGSLTEKSAASTLISLLTRPDESPSITTAAADALATLTGLRDLGRDVQKWRRWWQSNQDKSDTDFRLSLLNNRAARFDQLQLRHRQLEEEIASLLSDNYQLAPDSQKPEILQRYFKSSEPSIRAAGARLTSDDAINNRTIPPTILESLRAMIGDSSPDVRIAVAEALRVINDPASVPPLLTQLAQETDDAAKASLARTAGASGDLRAVPPLRSLLHNPAYSVATAAADGLRELGPKLLADNPAAAQSLAAELNTLLDGMASDPGAQSLRAALITAAAPLKQPTLLPTYYRLLRNPAEPVIVRRAAVKALGQLNPAQAADALVTLVEDPDPSIRLEAVDALGQVASFQNAQSLLNHLKPSEEPDPAVREHAWQVLSGLFKSAPESQLKQYAERFSTEPARRLVILHALEDQQAAANEEKDLATTRKTEGETLLALNRPADAVSPLRTSLQYWTSTDPHGMTANTLRQQLLSSLLSSKQYTDAVHFGSDLISSDPAEQQTVGPALRAEARRLLETNDLPHAQSLLSETTKMTPSLDERYLTDLTDLQTEVRRRLAEADHRKQTGPHSQDPSPAAHYC